MFDREAATPSEVVAEAIARLTAEDYSAAAELYHPDFVAGHVESEAELEALQPSEAFARQLRAADHRWRFRAYLDGLAEQYPQYRDQLMDQRERLSYIGRPVVLGDVEQGDRAYVVLGPPEAALEGRKPEAPDDGLAETVVLRRSLGGWRVSSGLGLSDGTVVVHLHVAVKDRDGKTVVLS